LETNKSGSIEIKTLNEIEEGKKARVLEVLGGMGMRQHLSTLGIHAEDIVLVKRSSAWGGPILIEVHGSEVAVGRGVASKVQVEEL
jgi:ferrous iron transport protein A